MNENFLGLFVSMCLKAGVLLLLACQVEKRLKNLNECLLALAFLVTFLAMQKSNAWGAGHADAPGVKKPPFFIAHNIFSIVNRLLLSSIILNPCLTYKETASRLCLNTFSVIVLKFNFRA